MYSVADYNKGEFIVLIDPIKSTVYAMSDIGVKHIGYHIIIGLTKSMVSYA